MARFLGFTKVLSEIPFSKISCHTETSQSIFSSNQSVFSDLRSIIDLEKVHYNDFKQNQASFFFSELGAHLNFFFPCERAGFSVLVNISIKKN